MTEPIFIEITDFNSIAHSINIKHIFSISEQPNWKQEMITTVSFYKVPECDSDILHLKTSESKSSILSRIEEAKQ